MNQALKILFVEDSPDDLEIMLLMFSQNSLSVDWERVQTEPALLAALSKDWDIVICDYKMPGFSGIDALKIIKKQNGFLPVIIVSGTMGEEQAVATLKNGASDYIMKDKLLKLLPAVENAIKSKKFEKENHFAQQMIIDSEERFRSIIQNSNAGYFQFDNFGNLYKANQAFLSLYKYNSISDVFGKHFSSFFFCSNEGCIDSILAKVFEGELIETIDLVRICKDNTRGYQTCSINPIFKRGKNVGFEGFVIDITDKKKYEDKLKQSEKEKNLILNTITESIVYFDSELNIVWTNREYTDNKNNTKDKVCHFMLYGREERCTDCPVQKALDTKQIEEREYGDEKDNYYLIRAYPILNSQNEVVNVIEVAWDLSQRKKAERELELAKLKAEESDNLKTAFLTNMSHEIRTPMNAVLGFSQLLAKENISNSEKVMYIDYIKKNGKSLVKIIDDIIDISKIQSKQIVLKNRQFNLIDLMKELKLIHQAIIDDLVEKNITLNFKLSDKINNEFFVTTDEIRLKQVMNNLISNAIKYTEKGSVDFGFVIYNKTIEFYVKDTGIGIKKENIRRIFKRFVQFSKEYISRQYGTGLGLSISKELVALLGGYLKVETEYEVGSKFYFELPLVEQKTQENDVDYSNSKNENYDWKNFKILIVDDEESNYVLTKRIIKDTGADSYWAKNGIEAVEQASTNSYHLILMDIKMPQMDGIEATIEIRKSNNKIPIIIQTAYAVSTEKEKAERAGCNDYFVKPIEISEFLHKVNRYLKKL
ncbi:MAG: response regulator [Salinivirgaceae bacterium]|nr:response regulator [Salinivirgaceae bacterium]